MLSKMSSLFCVLLLTLLVCQSALAERNTRQCLQINQRVNVTYTLRDGKRRTQSVVVGRNAQGTPANPGFKNGCLGRCGEGCGRYAGRGNYALDCLIHDVCAFNDKEFGGIADRDCGDEFRRAINDTITFGRSRCFISGTRVQQLLGN